MTFHSPQDETSEWLNYLEPEGLAVGGNVLRETGVTPIRQTPRPRRVRSVSIPRRRANPCIVPTVTG